MKTLLWQEVAETFYFDSVKAAGTTSESAQPVKQPARDLAVVPNPHYFSFSGGSRHVDCDGSRPFTKPCIKQHKRSDLGLNEQFSLGFTTFHDRRAKHVDSGGLRPFTKPSKIL